MFKQEIENELKNGIIPFWKSLKDEENGGFYGLMNFDLETVKNAEKGCILNSRILWFFSNAYGLLNDNSLLSHAKHAYDYLVDVFYDKEYHGLFWSVTSDGKVLDDTKHTYNQAFGIYALSSYYKVSSDERALERALNIFELIESKCKDEYGYLEAFDRYFKPASNEKLSENGVQASKTMNTLLHVFEAYTELYEVTNNAMVKQALVSILDIIRTKVFNTKLNRQEVFFDEKMNSISDIHSYGHDIEAAWLIDKGCLLLNDPSITKDVTVFTSLLIEEVYKTAFEEYFVVNESHNKTLDQTRVWWVQAESIVGFYHAYLKHPEEIKYKEAAQNIWSYTKNNMIDSRPNSEWFWELDNCDQPSNKRPIVEPWKCPYHNGRMCFEILKRSERN